MRISDSIFRRPLPVAFGQATQSGGLSSVDLATTRDADTVYITASDGSVAPVPGADQTTAGVMTAADKALLDSLAASAADGQLYDTRADLAAASVPAPVQAVRTAGYYAAGDGGGALYKRVGSEPAHALKVQSADGAWWELVPEGDALNVRAAGAKGDGVTDDSQAFVDCLNYAKLHVSGSEAAGWKIIVPATDAHYYLGSTTLEIKAKVTIEGQNGGLGNSTATELKWAANTTGIIVHAYNTIGATVEATPTTEGGGTVIRGIKLTSLGGTIANITDDTKGHGIWLRAQAVIEDVQIEAFPGNGIHIVADIGGGNAVEGNANLWMVNRVRIVYCALNGIYVDGQDANSGVCIGADVTSCGRWGIKDSSFLGNTYIGCHTQSCGVALAGDNPSGSSSLVEYGGNRYFANANATEAQLVATTPGTDENVWMLRGPGGATSTVPTWQPGQPEGTYFVGGCYRTDDPNARNLFIGCYREDNQGEAQFVAPTTVFGGSIGYPRGTGLSYYDDRIVGPIELPNTVPISGANPDLFLAINWQTDKLLKAYKTGDHASGMTFLGFDPLTGNYIVGENGNLAARRPMYITTEMNLRDYGRSGDPTAVGAGQVAFERGIWIGKGSNARFFGGTWNLTGPATGEKVAKGDIWLRQSPANSGSVAGWRCWASGPIGSGGGVHEFFFVPELPSNKGAVLRPRTSANEIEWRDAPKAGTATIADTTSSVAVTFTTAFPNANYAVTLTPGGNETLWVTNKTATGFTINRAGSAGALAVDWTATPHENL